MRRIACLVWGLGLAAPAVAQVTIADQIIARQTVVAGTTIASASPLTVVGLPAAAGAIVRIGAGGLVGIGPLVAGDVPSVFTRRDVAEVIPSNWTFSGGLLSLTNATSNTIAFPSLGGYGPPTLTTRSIGTKATWWGRDAPSTEFEYATGIDGGTLWASVPASGARFAWFANDGDTINETGTPGADLVAELTGTRDFLPGMGYSGNLGLFNRKWLTLNAAELWVSTLVAQETIATIGGRVLVGPTTTLTRDLAPGDTVIWVKHNAFQLHVPGVELGSKLVLETYAAGVAKFEVVAVQDTTTPGASAGEYGYTVTRNLDGSGANAWTAGDAVFDTGKTGSGFIDLYALRGLSNASQLGPTIVGNVRTADAYNAWSPRWALGNLQGLYGYGATTYGAAFGNASSTFVAVDATNGFRVVNASTTIGQWDTAGVVTIGPVTSSTTGKMVIDSDSVDISYRGATLFSIYSSGSSLAKFDTPLWTNSGLMTPSIAWLSGNLALSTSTNLSAITLQPGPSAPVSGAVLPGFDSATPLGSATKRWTNIHLNLPVQSGSLTLPPSGFPYLVTGDRTDVTRLGYVCGVTATHSLLVGTATCASGAMYMIFQCGVLVTSGCY